MQQPKYRELLSGESGPAEYFEEHGDESDSIWRSNLTKKWQRKRLLEIQAERVRAASNPRATELNRELAEFVVTLIGWRGALVPPALISSLQSLAKSQVPAWPGPLCRSLDLVRRPLNEFNATKGIGSENLKLLLKELPAITSQVQALGIESSLPADWNHFCDSLLEQTLAYL